jgi:hypothetical protein
MDKGPQWHFSKEDINGQKTYEKMFNITNYQRKAG